MKNKIINFIAIASIIAILAGVLIAIWFGWIGLKIAASGAVTLAADYAVYWWVRDARNNTKTENKNGGK